MNIIEKCVDSDIPPQRILKRRSKGLSGKKSLVRRQGYPVLRRLTTCVGIRLFSAYSSVLRLTKSNSEPKMVVRAVSRCFERSGLLSILAILSTWSPLTDEQKKTSCSAKGNPIIDSRAISMSLLGDPSN